MYCITDDGDIQKIYDGKELAEAVLNTIEWYKKDNEKLTHQNKMMHDHAKEVVKHEYEKEIKYLNERLALSYGEFASKKEKDAYDDFERRHMHDRIESKYNGGRAPYLIPTGTGIGTILHVKCPICGAEENITDTEMW